jgi:SPP1 family predicted phage head-tail adaptor
MIPRIGTLRRRIAVEAAQDTPDGAGGFIRAWVPVATVWGAVRPLRLRDSGEDGRRVGVVTHEITIRRRTMTGGMRLVADGVRYRVAAVEDADPARRFVTCLCEEEQA